MCGTCCAQSGAGNFGIRIAPFVGECSTLERFYCVDSAQAVWGQLRAGTVLLVFQDETGSIRREVGVTIDEFLFRQVERGRDGGDVRIAQPNDSRNAATGSAAEAAETGCERFFLNVCLHGQKPITTVPKSQSAILLAYQFKVGWSGG